MPGPVAGTRPEPAGPVAAGVAPAAVPAFVPALPRAVADPAEPCGPATPPAEPAAAAVPLAAGPAGPAPFASDADSPPPLRPWACRPWRLTVVPHAAEARASAATRAVALYRR